MKLTKRNTTAESSTSRAIFGDAELADLERRHPEGVSAQQIVALFAERGHRLSEASFRKYVQQGLLPRSRRVGRKGKHRGSQGLYPVTVLRQLVRLRSLMAQGFTIEEIRSEFLFVRADVEALTRQLDRVFASLSHASERDAIGSDRHVDRALGEARDAGAELLRQLEAIEERLTMRARMARAAV